MVLNEKELAKAIMRRDSRIELHKDLIGGVEKIKTHLKLCGNLSQQY